MQGRLKGTPSARGGCREQIIENFSLRRTGIAKQLLDCLSWKHVLSKFRSLAAKSGQTLDNSCPSWDYATLLNRHFGTRAMQMLGMRAEFCPTTASSSRNLVECGSKLADVRPTPVEIGRSRPNFGILPAKLRQFCQFDRNWANDLALSRKHALGVSP